MPKTHKDFAAWLVGQQSQQLNVARTAREGLATAAMDGRLEEVLQRTLQVAQAQGALAVLQRALSMADAEADWLSIALETGEMPHVTPMGSDLEQRRHIGAVAASRQIASWIQYERTAD